MQRKTQIDTFGAVSLIAFSLLLGLNQVVIKFTNEGLQPVFLAGIRSLGAVICLLVWMRWRGLSLRLPRETIPAAFLTGLLFTAEFVFLFMALDLTTVTRSSVIFYSMPVWLGLAGHFLIPGERLTTLKTAGLGMAFLGVALALMTRGSDGAQASLAGDLCALASAMCWAGIAVCAKVTKMKETRPEVQLFYQVLISAPILLLISPLFGPFIRAFEPVHIAAIAFQIVVVVSFGFIFWLWLLSIYPANGVASFSFLGPVFGVFLGWLLLGETIGPWLLISLAMVALGIILINRPDRSQVPQNVA